MLSPHGDDTNVRTEMWGETGIPPHHHMLMEPSLVIAQVIDLTGEIMIMRSKDSDGSGTRLFNDAMKTFTARMYGSDMLLSRTLDGISTMLDMDMMGDSKQTAFMHGLCLDSLEIASATITVMETIG
eukprot:7028096-Karenia_brevis.AAC.1